jgi:hypothetical protein
VIRPFGLDESVHRRGLISRLAYLLKGGLRIGEEGLLAERIEVRPERLLDEAAAGLKAAIEKDRTDEGFVGASEVRRAVASAAGLLSFSEEEGASEVQTARDASEGVAPNEVRTQLGQAALVERGILGEELVGDDQAEDRVAEELEALVGHWREIRSFIDIRAVHERFLEKGTVLEPDA